MTEDPEPRRIREIAKGYEEDGAFVFADIRGHRQPPILNGHWAIVGGESGPHARPMKSEWVFDIRDQCARAHVPFFFKQWGGVNKKKTGRQLEDRTWDEMPDDRVHLQVVA